MSKNTRWWITLLLTCLWGVWGFDIVRLMPDGVWWTDLKLTAFFMPVVLLFWLGTR